MQKRDFIKASLFTLGALLIPRKTLALDYYPTKSDIEWAILFGTWCGTARDASVWISEGMDGIADVFDVREKPDLSKYKYIVVGGAIRSGEVSKELQDYLAVNKSILNNKVKGLFAVCGNMKQPVTQVQYDNLIGNHLAKLTGARNVASKVFLGRITWGLLEPEIQKQMKSIPNMEEYDNLKRSDCLKFGKEILQSVNQH
jgi:menaquinone-dependent protoporphyrinogen IX oxidase